MQTSKGCNGGTTLISPREVQIMGKEGHILPANKIGIFSDEPQWCWWISEEICWRELQVQYIFVSSSKLLLH